jgi:hypothetical protein
VRGVKVKAMVQELPGGGLGGGRTVVGSSNATVAAINDGGAILGLMSSCE